MDRETFVRHFRLLLDHLREITAQFCFNDLADTHQFIIEPSERSASPHLTDVENGYLRTWNKYRGKQLSFEQVVDLLYKDGATTKWADCSVYYSSPGLTIVHIFFSSQFRDEHEIYYLERGTGPFKAVVSIPPDDLRILKGDKFDVNWKKNLDERNAGVFSKLRRLFSVIIRSRRSGMGRQ